MNGAPTSLIRVGAAADNRDVGELAVTAVRHIGTGVCSELPRWKLSPARKLADGTAAVTLGAKNVAPQHSYSEGRQMQSQPFANSRDQLDLLCRYAMREWANMAQARWLC